MFGVNVLIFVISRFFYHNVIIICQKIINATFRPKVCILCTHFVLISTCFYDDH